MIKGIGIDCTHISRFVHIINNSKICDKFIAKIYSPSEIQHISTLHSTQLKAQYMASRWAIKESVIKSTGIKISPPQISSFYDSIGKPRVAWNSEHFELSVTHDEDVCIAVSIWLQNNK